MHAYNKDMKNHFKAIVITLLVILCIFTGLSGAALFGLQRQVSSLTASFVNPSDEPSEKGEVTLSAPQTLTRFYQTLVSELNEYGDPAKTQEASARLLTQVFVKTMKDCTVRTIEYKPDGLEIEIQGVCVPFDQIDSSLASSVLYSSLGRYAMSHPRGKIEILGRLPDGETVFKFHQSRDDEDNARLFTQQLSPADTWLDEELRGI